MTDQAGGTAWADEPGSPGPNVARVYDYLLGGKDHFAVDRQAAQQLIAAMPDAPAAARANRAFLAAAVRHTPSQARHRRPQPAQAVSPQAAMLAGVGRKVFTSRG